MTATASTMQTTPEEAADEARVEAFAGQLFTFFTGGLLSCLIDIGDRTGLFAAVAQGPGTSHALAERAGLQERYVREWLSAMVTAGVVDHDAATATYRLPPEHAVCLTSGGDNLAPFARLTTHLADHVGRVAEAFRGGGGVPYDAFRPDFTDVMDALGRDGFDRFLLSDWVPLVPGLRERLEAGAHVADVGCGTGHALVLLARAFPASTFVGFDLAEDAITHARREAADEGLENVQFEVRDVVALPDGEPFDVVFAFDTIHDLVAPARVLRAIRDVLTPDGMLLAFEPHGSSDLEDNIGHPLAPFLYSISTLHCLTISLAHDGAGLGTIWGEQRARRMLHDAGFRDVAVHDLPGEPVNALYDARP